MTKLESLDGIIGPEAFVGRVTCSPSNKSELLTAVATALEFPGYWGHNWDALLDCLTDFCWRSEYEIVLVHEAPLDLPATDKARYLDILEIAISDWTLDPSHRFRVLIAQSADRCD